MFLEKPRSTLFRFTLKRYSAVLSKRPIALGLLLSMALLLFPILSLSDSDVVSFAQPDQTSTDGHNVRSASLTRPAERDKSEQIRLPTVAFITYELYPVTTWGGGAGVVINGLVMDLLEHGHDVIVLADFGRDYVMEWEKLVLLNSFKGKLYVFQLADLLAQNHVEPSKSIFIYKSRSFALGLQLIYAQRKFDIVECFDYAGVAYELLRTKPAGTPDYLPDRVAVAIRFHGSLQLIDRAEGKESDVEVVSERSLMYLQEQFAIRLADLLFCQTSFMRARLASNYEIDVGDIMLAHPPVESVLRYVEQSMLDTKDLPETWNQKKTVLIYGRFQLVKGLETIVKAGLELIRDHPAETGNVQFLFVGPDMYAEEHGTMTSQYLGTLIPPEHASHFDFRPSPIDRKTLATYCKDVYAAIFASTFETLNLAVHEVARMNVPLILSDIPAFLEFFAGQEQARFFKSQDASSLQSALFDMLLTQEGERKVAAIRAAKSRIAYKDALAVYTLYTLPFPLRRWNTVSKEMEGQIATYERKLNS